MPVEELSASHEGYCSIKFDNFQKAMFQNVTNVFTILSFSNRFRAVFLNRRATAWYRALASIISGRKRPEETTICNKISLVQLITNLNVIFYLSI